MKFRFPIVIIDEDFRSENTSGLGIRALADALEKEGMEVLGVTATATCRSSRNSSRALRPSFCRLMMKNSEAAPLRRPSMR